MKSVSPPCQARPIQSDDNVQETKQNATRLEGMVFIAGGSFLMGSDRHYPEEAPAHRVAVDGFWIDRTPVTNAQFKKFVEATGYLTRAERPLRPEDYPGIPSHLLQPGSLVFVPPPHVAALDDWRQWWTIKFGACWRCPYGNIVSSSTYDDHPAVHIAYEDAAAYARWAGKELPTEAEWEFAARGRLDGADYAWGDDFMPGGFMLANIWQGRFPNEKLGPGGFKYTTPVGRFPENGYGLLDMIGNVWEWTADFYAPRHDEVKSCCVPHNPRNIRAESSFDPDQPQFKIPRRVIKGGSHLCAPTYCRRYRPAARQAQAIDSSTSHIGFRCIARV